MQFCQRIGEGRKEDAMVGTIDETTVSFKSFARYVEHVETMIDCKVIIIQPGPYKPRSLDYFSSILSQEAEPFFCFLFSFGTKTVDSQPSSNTSFFAQELSVQLIYLHRRRSTIRYPALMCDTHKQKREEKKACASISHTTFLSTPSQQRKKKRADYVVCAKGIDNE